MVVAEEAQHVARISATALNVAKELPCPVLLQGFQNIFGFAAQWIDQPTQQHVADLGVRDNLMAGFYRQRAGDQLMVNRLIHLPFAGGFRQTHPGQRGMQRHVNLIKGQPESDFMPVTGKYGTGVVTEEINHPPIAPAPILRHQSPGHLIV